MRLLLTLAVATVMAGCASVEIPSGPPLQVSEVIAVEGKDATQLCIASRDWTAKSFHDSNAVVEVFDAQRGKLIGKGNMQLPVGLMSVPVPVNFTMTIDCKDGRVRAAFADYSTGAVRAPLVEDATYRLQSRAKARTLDLIADLRQYLANPPRNDF